MLDVVEESKTHCRSEDIGNIPQALDDINYVFMHHLFLTSLQLYPVQTLLYPIYRHCTVFWWIDVSPYQDILNLWRKCSDFNSGQINAPKIEHDTCNLFRIFFGKSRFTLQVCVFVKFGALPIFTNLIVL